MVSPRSLAPTRPQHRRRRSARLAVVAVALTCLFVAAPSAASAAPALTVNSSTTICEDGGLFPRGILVNVTGSGFTPGSNVSWQIDYPDGNYSAGGSPDAERVGADGTFTRFLFINPLVEGTYTIRFVTDEDTDLELDPGGEVAEAQVTAHCAAPQPTTKEDCLKEGYRVYEVFKNQGDCVAFLSTDGKNEPGQNVPGSP
jgi:hypothetical protein